uniref:Uncharacterized protein n=1 Tax=Schistosoma japonicum TaxID=6182 RepID=Q5C3W0_SCHJA|nr:unknown [Schistosoma japonicum]
MARSFWRSSHYLEWLLDRQDVMIHRANDLKILGSEEEYQKVMLFFTDGMYCFYIVLTNDRHKRSSHFFKIIFPNISSHSGLWQER